ncbi:YcdB/YcdC domain-containing protein [Paenibacillus rhizoplanae]
MDNGTRLSEEELKQQAEQFLEDHYPGALRDFPYCEMEWMEGMFGYTRQQKAMGLPLPETGCLIMVHPNGRVVGFRYYGTVPGPALPTMITPEEEQMACMKANFCYMWNIAYWTKPCTRMVTIRSILFTPPEVED